MKRFTLLACILLTVYTAFLFVSALTLRSIDTDIEVACNFDIMQKNSTHTALSDSELLSVLSDLQGAGAMTASDLASKYFETKFALDTTYADVVGWIRIKSLGIDYPIMSNVSDNNWYLKHNWKGEESKWGSISMDIQSKGEWTTHTLLNGHNMKDDSMFGRLPELFNEDTFNSVSPIEVFDGARIRTYKIFSVFSVNDQEENLPIVESSITDYSAKLVEYQQRSLYCRDIPQGATEALLLNTCWYGASGTERHLHCIVVAYRQG